MFYENELIGLLSHVNTGTITQVYFIDIGLKLGRIAYMMDTYKLFPQSNLRKRVKYDDERFVRFALDLNLPAKTFKTEEE